MVREFRKKECLIRFNYSTEFSRLVCCRGRKGVMGSRIVEAVQTAEGRRNLEVEML